MSLINPNNQNASIDEQQQMAAFAQIIKSASDMECEKCKNLNFLNVFRIKKVSGLMSGTGRDMIVPISVYACSDCGHVNSYFLSKVGISGEEEGENKENALL